MPRVRVSAERFRSMLVNRNLTTDDVASVAHKIPLRELTEHDQVLEFDDIQVLAKFFKRPWSYLLHDEAEQFPDAGDDNRTFANQRRLPSPELLLELEAADFMLAAASELFPGQGFVVPTLPAGTVPAERLAAEIRALLGVTINDQLAINDEFAALRHWIAAIHALGVYVSQRSLKDPTIRAFSKVRDGQALIVVDTSDTAYARVFSALHEYCHVVLRSTGICDLDDHSAVERYCNKVAAAVLLPSELLDQEVPHGSFGGTDEAADDFLGQLSRRLHVSQAALLIRLRDHGAIAQELYDQLEGRRAARRGAGKRSGGSYYAPAINRVGRLFAHRVVDSVRDDVINRQDAAALLGVGEHLVDRFTTELLKGESEAT